MAGKELGPQPEPEIEPGEPSPGGVDAVDAADGVDGERGQPDHDGRDLDPKVNPAIEDALPEEMRQPEDTSTEATTDDDGERDTEQEEESPA
jgi:hypothetical protein